MIKLKYFLGLLVLGLLFPISNSFGYVMRDLVDDFNSCSSCVHSFDYRDNGGSLALQYYYLSEGLFTSTPSNAVSLDYMADLRSSRMIRDQPNVGYVSYPLVGFQDNGAGGITFKYFVHGDSSHFEDFNVPSRAGFTHTFLDGSSCLMNQVFFNAGSIIFKCSDSNKTFQIMAGGSALGGGFLYLDAYNSTNNVRYINWQKGKARAKTMEKEEMSKILFGDYQIGTEFMQNLFSTGYDSYTVSSGGTNIFPTCGLRTCNSQNLNSSSVGFSYTKDLITVDPDFGGNNNNQGYTDPVFIDDTASYQEQVNNYYSCVDLYSDYNVVANSFVLCRQDYINNRVSQNEYNSMIAYVKSSEIIDDRSWTGYTTSETGINCTLLVENARSMAKRQFIDQGLILSDYITVISRLENSGTNPYDLNVMCGSKPTNAGTGVSSNDCNLSSWQNIVNCFGGGSQTSSGSDSSLFSSAVDNIKIMVGNTFDNTFLDPIKDKFDEGYNYLMGGVSCTTKSLEIPYINLLVYVMAMLIFFSLYKIL